MRTYKKLDIAVQILILATSLSLLFVNVSEALGLYLILFFIWDLLSIIIHAVVFKVDIQQIESRRMAIFLHTLAIIALPFMLLPAIGIWGGALLLFYGYLIYAACLPLYYLWVSYHELQVLNKIHDQASLIDIGQH